jgi:hypothetical protein
MMKFNVKSTIIQKKNLSYKKFNSLTDWPKDGGIPGERLDLASGRRRAVCWRISAHFLPNGKHPLLVPARIIQGCDITTID